MLCSRAWRIAEIPCPGRWIGFFYDGFNFLNPKFNILYANVFCFSAVHKHKQSQPRAAMEIRETWGGETCREWL
jgi:hypothetical protein